MNRLWLAVPFCMLAVRAEAVVTATWSVETYQQFDAGDATNAFITSSGEVRPGWDTKRTPLEGDAVWSALRLADGSVLLGSDAGGAIYRTTGEGVKKLVAIEGAIGGHVRERSPVAPFDRTLQIGDRNRAQRHGGTPFNPIFDPHPSPLSLQEVPKQVSWRSRLQCRENSCRLRSQALPCWPARL